MIYRILYIILNRKILEPTEYFLESMEIWMSTLELPTHKDCPNHSNGD